MDHIETGADRQLNIERQDIINICIFGQGQHSTLNRVDIQSVGHF
jgi:hypothetical protein